MPAESGDRNAVLSDQRNIVVIADEAHRSQYNFIDGFARHMRDALPQASFARTNTRAVFGDYISVYDIQRAVEDGATVPIYYEGRLAKLELSEAERRSRLSGQAVPLGGGGRAAREAAPRRRAERRRSRQGLRVPDRGRRAIRPFRVGRGRVGTRRSSSAGARRPGLAEGR